MKIQRFDEYILTIAKLCITIKFGCLYAFKKQI